MKRIIYLVTVLISAVSMASCSDWLELKPRDKISGEDLFKDPAGVKAYMANIYARLPIEDFATSITNLRSNDGSWDSFYPSMIGDEGVYTSPYWFSEWNFTWSDYDLIRNILELEEYVPDLEVSVQEKEYIQGEIAFCLAYCYFALTKRLGGMPILREPIDYDPDLQKMFRPRDKEIDCWNYVMEKCDEAIEYLPDTFDGESGRANKWVAYALKSRAALYAGSYAKNWNKVPLSGEAVEQEVVGLKPEHAPAFYKQCIEASEAIIKSGRFGLYKPNPANPDEAAANYQHLFETPADALASSPTECIWIKWYDEPGGTYKGHSYDVWLNPNQTRGAWGYGGFMSPILELVDLYEEYSPDGVRESAPMRTKNVQDPLTQDINVYGSFTAPCGFDPSADYIHYDSPLDAFANKDARLHATAILPMSTWKGTQIIIQGGIIDQDGNAILKQNGSAVGKDGKTYYAYGSDDFNQYSGYDEPHQGSQGGFLFKKFLQESIDVPANVNRGTNDWIEFRYAEILLNYAEAVASIDDATAEQKALAAESLNAIRHRAAHTDNIPLTLQNVLDERRIELAFENKRIWDLIRLREFNYLNNYRRKDLIPVLDLREDPPKYIFLRADVEDVDRSFRNYWYYRALWQPLENGLLPQPTN